MKHRAVLLFLLVLLFLVACSTNPSSSTNSKNPIENAIEQTPVSKPYIPPSRTPTSLPEDTATPRLVVSQSAEPALATAILSPTVSQIDPSSTVIVTSTPGPDDWKSLPVIPKISQNVVDIYRRGIKLGNNPRAFSKIGDCGSTPAWFLGDFDRGPRFYHLGEYQNLSQVIEAFQGSYSRTSLAAKSGFNASSIFAPLWSDPKKCQSGEAPLACEYRVHQPTIAYIMLGSNDVYHPDEFEPQMRKIIEYSIDHGIVPILSTKADNVERDSRINATIARLALEYDIPLWNYWRAVQDLPDQGLQEDKVHLTWGANRFDDPLAMTRAWPVRNLNALQILAAIWDAVSAE